jgi:phosphorylcholine metabolism protein LicD
MFKNIIKNILFKLKIYNSSRALIIKLYYPYKRYLLKKEAANILEKLYNIFSKNCTDFWLDYGTLLGYVREKALIKNDIDLDFGVVTEKKLATILQQNGFRLTQQTLVENKIAMEQYSYKGIGFDIFYYTKKDNNICTYIWLPTNYNQPQKQSYQQQNGNLYKIIFAAFATTNIEFLGKKFKIPQNFNSYLAQHYGKDFLTPNPNFTHKDEKNKTISNKPFKVIFYE